jgi:hypothetical protein
MNNNNLEYLSINLGVIKIKNKCLLFVIKLRDYPDSPQNPNTTIFNLIFIALFIDLDSVL